jgi:DNA-binding transcriptional ArsR family regulator
MPNPLVARRAGYSVVSVGFSLSWQRGALTNPVFAGVLQMTVSAVSQHLRKLKDGGVLRAHKVGQTVFYALGDRHLPVLRPLLAGLSVAPTSQPV